MVGRLSTRGEVRMRKLNERFLSDLEEGALCSLLAAVQRDDSLCLELRGTYINLYYRGGNLLRINQEANFYRVFFDTNYFSDKNGAHLPEQELCEREHVEAWLGVLPRLKHAMDQSGKLKEEREVQQHLVRANNGRRLGKATDYYVCDIEYAGKGRRGQFDLVAVHWPSNPTERKRAENRRLVLMELKYGDGALVGSSGVSSHIEDLSKFLSDSDRVESLKTDMVHVFNQKRRLGLLNCDKDLARFSDEKPLLLLVFADHDPDKRKLGKVLDDLPNSPHAEVRIATAPLMGYGLFGEGMTVDSARERLRQD